MSFLNNLNLAVTGLPDLFFEKMIVSYTKNNLKVNFDSVLDTENPDKTLIIKVKLRCTDISRNNNSFLKFKAIFCFSEMEENLYKNSMYAISKNKNLRKTEIFSKENFIVVKDANKELKFLKDVETRIYKSDISNISYLSIVFLPYYDLEDVVKKHNLSLEGIEQPETLFFGNPKSQILIKDGRIFDEILATTINEYGFERSKEKFNSYLENRVMSALRSQFLNSKNIISSDKLPVFSDLFATHDFILSQKTKEKKYKSVVRYGLFFDQKRFLKERCVFPEFVREFDQNLEKRFLDRSSIVSYSMRRFRADTNSIYNNLEERELDKEESEISVSSLTNLDDLLFISGIDKEFDILGPGKYKYKLQLKFQDASYDILTEIRDGLYLNLNTLKEYFQESKIPETFFVLGKDDPHIDDDIKYQFNVRHGSYIQKEDRFNDSLQEKYFLKLQDIINYFSKIELILHNAKNVITDEERAENIKNNTNLKTSIYNSIMPNTGNTTGVLNFIDLHEKIILTLNTVLSSKGKSSINNNFKDNRRPKKIQELQQEQTFDNFIADKNIPKNFGFNYFREEIKENNNILHLSAKDIAISDNYKLKLNDLLLPIKNEFVKINIADYYKKLDNEEGDSLYTSLDNFLESFGKEDFLQNLKNPDFVGNLFSLSNELQNAKTTNSKKNIQEKNIAEKKDFSRMNEKFNCFKYSGIQVRTEIKDLTTSDRSFFEEKVKERRREQYTNPAFNFLSSDYNSKLSTNYKINMEVEKINFSKVKIKEGTTKKINYISFPKDQNGNYLLKNAIFSEFDIGLKNGTYFCMLAEEKKTPKVYNEIPVINSHFLYEKVETDLSVFMPNPPIPEIPDIEVDIEPFLPAINIEPQIPPLKKMNDVLLENNFVPTISTGGPLIGKAAGLSLDIPALDIGGSSLAANGLSGLAKAGIDVGVNQNTLTSNIAAAVLGNSGIDIKNTQVQAAASNIAGMAVGSNIAGMAVGKADVSTGASSASKAAKDLGIDDKKQKEPADKKQKEKSKKEKQQELARDMNRHLGRSYNK